MEKPRRACYIQLKQEAELLHAAGQESKVNGVQLHVQTAEEDSTQPRKVFLPHFLSIEL